MKSRIRIASVVVTYNRLDKLKKSLASYEAQTRMPDYMIIVDNASTDGTEKWLNEWKARNHAFSVDIIRSEENLGGSGGFYLGEEKAIKTDADWIMISDDDAYPDADYLRGMYEYICQNDSDGISIVCGAVEENNNFYSHHRSQFKKFKYQLNFLNNIPKEYYLKSVFYPDHASYVGILINVKKLLQAGLVDRDFFIWWDDTEHSIRLKKIGKIVCLPKYVIHHDVSEENKKISWKSYYGARNKLVCHKKHMKITYPFIVVWFLIKTLLSPLKGRSIAEVKLRLTAIKDAVLGNMGVNDVYKPGWKP